MVVYKVTSIRPRFRMVVGDSVPTAFLIHEPKALRLDLAVSNEATIDDALRRFPFPTINFALRNASKKPHFGRGSRCKTGPDWSLISDTRPTPESPDSSDSHDSAPDPLDSTSHPSTVNMLPGDTKVDAKWRPDMLSSSQTFSEWQKPVVQVVGYIKRAKVRYGFIVTDKTVVVLRIVRQLPGSGLATARAPRARPIADYSDAQQDDDQVPIGSQSKQDTVRRSSQESYKDTDPVDWEYNIEYEKIHWSKHGKNTLTAKLALWALAMMASGGSNHVAPSYPGLNTWRADGDEGAVIHNASGERRDQLPPGCHIEEPGRNSPVYGELETSEITPPVPEIPKELTTQRSRRAR